MKDTNTYTPSKSSKKCTQSPIEGEDINPEASEGSANHPHHSFSAKKVVGTASSTSFNPFLTMGFTPDKKSGKGGDVYLSELQEFMDNTLQLLAEKISEKKELEMECSSNRLHITNLKEEIKHLDSSVRRLKAQYQTENEACGKLERDNAELEELLLALKGKTMNKTREINVKLDSLKKSELQTTDQAAEYKKQLAEIRKIKDQERNMLKQEIRKIETTHIETNNKLEQIDQQMAKVRTIEQERLKILVSRSKLLNSLAEKEAVESSLILKKSVSKMSRYTGKSRSRSSGRFTKSASKF